MGSGMVKPNSPERWGELREGRTPLTTTRYQRSALRVASAALNCHILDVTNVFNGVAAPARSTSEPQIASMDTVV
jgi:hypothetical protein